VRSAAARCGHRVLTRAAPAPLRRFFATEADGIEQSADNSLKQLHSLEAQINTVPGENVSPLVPNAPAEAPIAMTVAEQYALYQKQKKAIGRLGSELSPHYKPHTLLSNPPTPADVTLELLLASEAHQGHATSLWNPANARYIHGIRQGTHIISLEATASHLRRAAKIVQEVSKRAGIILFVGTRDGQDTAVVRAAQLSKQYHLFERWIPGSITNGQQILGRCKTKVVNELDEEVPGYEDQLYDRPVLRPDLVVCMNPLENYVLLHECALNNIPTIGVIDTNADPTWVTYPIPANDDSLRCIQLIAGVLGRAGEAGTKQRLELAAQGRTTYFPGAHPPLIHPEEPEAEVKDTSAVLPNEDGLLPTAELDAKLEAQRDHDGRKTGHRIRKAA